MVALDRSSACNTCRCGSCNGSRSRLAPYPLEHHPSFTARQPACRPSLNIFLIVHTLYLPRRSAPQRVQVANGFHPLMASLPSCSSCSGTAPRTTNATGAAGGTRGQTGCLRCLPGRYWCMQLFVFSQLPSCVQPVLTLPCNPTATLPAGLPQARLWVGLKTSCSRCETINTTALN